MIMEDVQLIDYILSWQRLLQSKTDHLPGEFSIEPQVRARQTWLARWLLSKSLSKGLNLGIEIIGEHRDIRHSLERIIWYWSAE